jgi:membrane protein DedA with SNARE-associated domain
MTDVAAAYGMTGWPVEAVIGALFVIVMGRSHLFYWIGRGVTDGTTVLVARAGHAHEGDRAGAEDAAAATGTGAVLPGAATTPVEGTRARVRRLLTGPGARRGLAMVHRWGPFAVTLAYLTVGVQTVVFTSAGLLRMPYLRFTLASIPGSVAWALIWGTVGLGAAWAAVTLAAEQPWVLAGVVVALLAAATVLVLRRRARRSAADALAAEARVPADV